ncbi:hypothetical protein COCSADRAFT_230292 [Bipolaris sorokiniana ND90Pr]|uniref:Uncharacterized protein n=1 Tax=Cochliobolus sativus (strain ND90Pr / ATCC 201652) TaxID=665912 RepID=M2SFX8_COCSN|nr:uncharacterized protein COCSADRAFT_230292 [Bipolaris sorokiniana ND90Pr]EMD61345.1 hypothetical protein COCSADRAFT_230292 [Bipolaris sorokiniana ND90Pr]
MSLPLYYLMSLGLAIVGKMSKATMPRRHPLVPDMHHKRKKHTIRTLLKERDGNCILVCCLNIEKKQDKTSSMWMTKGDTVDGDYAISSPSTHTPGSVVSFMPHPTTSLLMFNHTTTPCSEFS